MKALMIGGMAALGLSATTIAQEAEETAPVAPGTKCPVSFELGLSTMSDYIWRGTICNDNPVWQPDVKATLDLDEYGKVSADVWSTFDLTHKRGTANNSRRSGGVQEMDYTLAYEVKLAEVTVSAGHIWYTFPNNNGSTDHELFAGVSYENDYVTPSATFYWSYSDSAATEASAVYGLLSLSRDFTLTQVSEALKLTPSASLGFGNHAYTDAGTEMTDQTIGVALSYKVNQYLSFGAQLNYTWTPSHELRQAGYMATDKDQIVWGGVNMKLAF